jgi:hypothetical protein
MSWEKIVRPVFIRHSAFTAGIEEEYPELIQIDSDHFRV